VKNLQQHLFVINPVAGKKDRSGLIRKAVERMLLIEPYEIVLTKCVGDATEIVKSRLENLSAESFLRIYSCGGDGTLSEVVEGVYKADNSNCAIGVVPIGSGNDFIKYFSEIPAEKFRSLPDMVKGKIDVSDVISVKDTEDGREHISVNIVSAGYDAAVAKGMEKYKKLPLVSGKAAYNLSVVECLISKMKNKFTLVADGVEVKDKDSDYLFAICANGSYYGGGFKASPLSNIKDGLMDFIRIKTVSRLTFAAFVGSFRKGEHLTKLKKYCTHMLCKELKIISENIIDVNIDGNIIPMKNPTISIIPKAIRLIMPE
jgi:diacylglycerol kinase (ATP)